MNMTMERYDMKRISLSTMALAMFAGLLLTTSAGVLQAADATTGRPYPGAAGEEAGSNLWRGSFDGYDRKAGMVWVNDRVFELAGDLKVIGTAKKAGTLSAIQLGETVTLLYGETGRQGIPVAIEIRRH